MVWGRTANWWTCLTIDPAFVDDENVPSGNRIDCRYYDVSNFNNKINTTQLHKSLSVLTVNVNSISANFNYLLAFLEKIKINFSIICITEIWLSKDTDIGFNLPGYNSHAVYNSTRRGGIKIYIKNNLSFSILKNLTLLNDFFQSVFIRIPLPNKKPLVFGGIYRSPSASKLEFNNSFSNLILNKIGHKYCIMAGDFNMNLLNRDIDVQINSFIDLMFCKNFMPFITLPTHLSIATLIPHSVLDQIWSNVPFDCDSAVFNYRFGYHLPACAFIPNLTSNPLIKTSFRNFNVNNINIFQQNLQNIIPNLNFVGNPEVQVTNFLKWLNQIIDKYFPIKHKTVSFKRIHSPWLTSSIMQCIDKKHVLSKNLKRGFITRDSYKNYCNLLTFTLKLAREIYYQNAYESASNNISKSWKITNNLLNRFNSPSTISLKINNQLITEPKIVAEKFLDFFHEAPIVTRNSIPISQNPLPNPFQLQQSMFFSPAYNYEIEKIINNLKNKKPNLTDIPIKVFKLMSKIISPHIATLFNNCFDNSHYPNVFKVARIVPVYKKKGDPHNIEFYRPISILSNLNKIFEKLIHNRLVSFIKPNNLISDSQYGFLKGRSTVHACYDLLANIHPVFTYKKIGICIFIDFSKAFDTIDYDLLFIRLSNLGIRGPSLNFIKSYLSNRRQFVRIEGCNSSNSEIGLGVPQGSVLGPLLFNLYANEISSLPLCFKIIQYADDTVFFLSGEDIEDMVERANSSLDVFSRWCNFNKLSLNASKTKYILFSPSPIVNMPNLEIQGGVIERVSTYKYLGLTVDEGLKFDSHIKLLKTRISQLSGISYKLGRFFSIQSAKSFYFAMIQSVLNYHIIFWGSSSTTNFNELCLKQNTIIRNLFKHHFPPNTSLSRLYKLTKIHKLPDLYKLNLALIVHQSLHTNKYPSTSRHIEELRWNHMIGTRRVHAFRLPLTRVLPDIKRFLFQALRYFNILPQNIRETVCYRTFKNQIKEKLFEDY